MSLPHSLWDKMDVIEDAGTVHTTEHLRSVPVPTHTLQVEERLDSRKRKCGEESEKLKPSKKPAQFQVHVLQPDKDNNNLPLVLTMYRRNFQCPFCNFCSASLEELWGHFLQQNPDFHFDVMKDQQGTLHIAAKQHPSSSQQVTSYSKPDCSTTPQQSVMRTEASQSPDSVVENRTEPIVLIANHVDQSETGSSAQLQFHDFQNQKVSAAAFLAGGNAEDSGPKPDSNDPGLHPVEFAAVVAVAAENGNTNISPKPSDLDAKNGYVNHGEKGASNRGGTLQGFVGLEEALRTRGVKPPRRDYFHQGAFTAISPGEWMLLDHNTENRWTVKTSWRTRIEHAMLEEFDDVSDKEKTFFRLWNAFVARRSGHNYIAQRDLANLCIAFVEEHIVIIASSSLEDPLICHMTNMCEEGFILRDDIVTTMRGYQDLLSAKLAAEKGTRTPVDGAASGNSLSPCAINGLPPSI